MMAEGYVKWSSRQGTRSRTGPNHTLGRHRCAVQARSHETHTRLTPSPHPPSRRTAHNTLIHIPNPTHAGTNPTLSPPLRPPAPAPSISHHTPPRQLPCPTACRCRRALAEPRHFCTRFNRPTDDCRHIRCCCSRHSGRFCPLGLYRPARQPQWHHTGPAAQAWQEGVRRWDGLLPCDHPAQHQC